MSKIWDETCKRLIQSNPQGFVELLLGDQATFINEAPRELIGTTLEVDGLLRAHIREQELFLHIEFQTRYDPLMAQRLLRYNVNARCTHRIPVHSFVFHLLSDSKLPPSPLRWTVPGSQGEEDVLVFHFTVVEVGQLTPEEILASSHETLLPFLPLAKGGAKREIVMQMDEALQKSGKRELLGLGYTFAALAMKKNPEDLRWIERRIIMQNMEDIPIFKWLENRGIEKGIEQGLQQGLQQEIQSLRKTLLTIVAARFPALRTQAQVYIDSLNETSKLQNLIVQVAITQSQEDAQRLFIDEKTSN